MKIYIRKEMDIIELENGKLVNKGLKTVEYTEEEYKELIKFTNKEECEKELKQQLKELRKALKEADKEDKEDIRYEIFDIKETLKEIKDSSEEDFYFNYDINLVKIIER